MLKYKQISEFPKEFKFRRSNLEGLNIEYLAFSYKHIEKLGLEIYLACFINRNPVKLSNYKKIIAAKKLAVENHFKKINISMDNKVFYVINLNKGGIRFFPDINFFKYIREIKEVVEDNDHIQLKGSIVIMSPSFSRGFAMLLDSTGIFLKDYNHAIVDSYQAAIQKIDGFIEKDFPESDNK